MNLNIENMDIQYLQYMTCVNLDNRQTKRILRRICKALSKTYDVNVLPMFFRDGMTCLVTDDREVISIIHKDDSIHKMYVNSPQHMLLALLKNGTHIMFSPLGRNKVDVDMNKMFGKNFEALNISLELMGF